MLTNEIYQNWSGMTANEYKKLKGIRKESLRDNMSDIELVLADLGELTTRDIVQTEKPYGIDENLKVAKRGGKVSLVAKELYEKETNRNAVTSENNKGIINVLENKD